MGGLGRGQGRAARPDLRLQDELERQDFDTGEGAARQMRRNKVPKQTSLSGLPTNPTNPSGPLPFNSGLSLESTAAAERLADYSRDSPLLGSPETDSGSESLKLSVNPSSSATTTTSTTMPEAASNTNNTDSHLSSLTAGFRDRLGFSQSQGGSGSTSSQRPSQSAEAEGKRVQVQMENGKWKEAPKKKRNPSANLDVPRAFLCNREEGQKTLDLSKSNISSLPPPSRSSRTSQSSISTPTDWQPCLLKLAAWSTWSPCHS